MQIIAFDYGEKKIGVAVGQTSTNTSSPLQIIFNKDKNTNWTSISSLLNESALSKFIFCLSNIFIRL